MAVSGYHIIADVSQMDIEVIHGFLSQSYWARGIPIATLKRAMKNSLCFAVMADSGEQVAFARMVTDRATFAYLADVFVVESHRTKGISKWLVETIMQHPELQNLRRIVLATRDAHGLYSKCGFQLLAHPEIFMEVWKPDVYQSR